MPDTIQPQQLIDALTANGWHTHDNGGSDGQGGINLWYPESRGLRAIHVPGHAGAIGSTLANLARDAEIGRRATAVLARLGGQPRDALADAVLASARAIAAYQARDCYPPEKYTWDAIPQEWRDRHIAAAKVMVVAAAPLLTVPADQGKSSTDEENRDSTRDPGPTHRAQSDLRDAENRLLTAQVERVRWMAGVAGRSLASGTAISQDLIDFTDDVRQLLDLPGCRYCTPGCTSCSFDGDCECYDHQDEQPVPLPCEFEAAGLDLSGPAHDVYSNLIAAKPGEVFSFEQEPGKRVLVIVSAVQALVETTGDPAAIAGWRHAGGQVGISHQCGTCGFGVHWSTQGRWTHVTPPEDGHEPTAPAAPKPEASL